MTNQQGAPEALRLADSLELCWGDSRLDEAAAELRRLHYENERLAAMVDAQQPACDTARYCQSIQRCTAKDETRAQQPAPSAAAAPVAVKAMGYGGSTGINDYLMSDGTVQAMRPSEVKWAPQPSPTPQADSQPAVDDLHALIDQYWDIAYTEGKEDRAHDTETGDAHNVRSSINCAISRLAARAPADSVMEDADPLQGAANWLAEAHGQFCVAVLQGCLMIGYNRAKRLHDAAIAARKQGGAI